MDSKSDGSGAVARGEMMTRLQPMFERPDEAERILRAEIAADALPDSDVDRVYVFELVLHKIVLVSKQGPALDPHSAADLGHRLDAIAMLIPLSVFEAGDLMLRITIYSDVMRKREFAVDATFERRVGNHGDVRVTPANAAMRGKIREFLEPVLPQGKCSETRVICARVVRQKIANGLATRGVVVKPGARKEGEEA
jgi:hypothetical protein